MSALPVGSGYDRALEVERRDCFARDPDTTKRVQQWEATGFTAFTAAEVVPKLQSAIVVGVKIETGERPLGEATAQRVGTSGEQGRFVTLARFTARKERAGDIIGAGSECSAVPASASNGIADFVTQCGDSFLAEKTFGGHVVISWQRTPSRPSVDDLMASMLGARNVGGTIDLQANLKALLDAGLGLEEVFIETAGIPLTPAMMTLPNGRQGYTVETAADFLSRVAALNVANFTRVTEYEFRRFDVPQVDLCLAETGRQSTMPEAEWACVHGHLSELADARDGAGDIAHYQDRYIEAKLVSEQLVPAGRVVFNTVSQSRCPGIDKDGDPNFEASGPCQEKSVADFVAFFEACTTKSANVLTTCRNQVLDSVDTCAAFEAKDCKAPEMTLSSGTVVTCSDSGMAAALADMVPWQVKPPFTPVSPPRGFQPPTVFQVDESMDGTHLPFTSSTHLCAVTGIQGGLHQADFGVAQSIGDPWLVQARQPATTVDRQVHLEVTCTAWENFYFYNGGSHSVDESRARILFPNLNADGFTSILQPAGITPLSTVWHYLDEPQTDIHITNPDTNGFPTLFIKDLFPFTSPWLVSFTPFTVQANPPLSGALPGGSLHSDTPGRVSSLSAGFGFPRRDPAQLASSLPANSFCFLTGLNGRFYNTSDWARVDTSDGFMTLRVSTPLTKDRNPGIIVQCIHYDQP